MAVKKIAPGTIRQRLGFVEELRWVRVGKSAVAPKAPKKKKTTKKRKR